MRAASRQAGSPFFFDSLSSQVETIRGHPGVQRTKWARTTGYVVEIIHCCRRCLSLARLQRI